MITRVAGLTGREVLNMPWSTLFTEISTYSRPTQTLASVRIAAWVNKSLDVTVAG